MKRTWKPCEELKASDFKTSPVWGFDLSREGKPEGADETWVRPFSLSRAPSTTDLLFVAAWLQPRDGAPQAGAVAVRFSDGIPRVAGVVLLEPRYCAVTLNDEVVSSRERAYLEEHVPNVENFFPMTYEAVLHIGSRDLVLRGIAKLAW
jgi:hypothetical protein